MRIGDIRPFLRSAVIAAFASGPATALELPARANPAPPTTSGVPHVQLGVEPAPGISEALLRRVEAHPNIEIRPTIVSLPGALGFWITENVTLARPDAIVSGREFAHLHPDGSLHASLSPALAVRAVEAGWATPHPWAGQRPGWEGFVMIYTPLTDEEADVVYQLVIEGFDFVSNGAPAGAPTDPPAPPTQPQSRRKDPSQMCSTC